jgi:glycosyltransferase involved in cell wall biosynthesis
MKLKILYLCSWLDPQNKRGWFFVEQGELLENSDHIGAVDYVRFLPFSPFKAIFKGLFNINNMLNHDGIRIYTVIVPGIRNEGRISSIITKFLLYRQLGRYVPEYDILHAQSLMNAGIYGAILSRKYNKHLFVTEHNQLSFFSSVFSRKTVRKALVQCQKRFVVSRDVIRQFATNGFFQVFDILHNPLHPVFMSRDITQPADYSQHRRSLVLATVGAYTPIKNHELVLRLLQRLDRESDLQIEFRWIGINSWGGDNVVSVKKILHHYNYSDRIRVTITPLASKSDLAALLSGTDFYICSSTCETFGLASLEALALGIPLLTTDNGGAREFANISNSVIVPVASDEALYTGFWEMLSRLPEFDRTEIAWAVRRKFSPELFVSKLLAAYQVTPQHSI